MTEYLDTHVTSCMLTAKEVDMTEYLDTHVTSCMLTAKEVDMMEYLDTWRKSQQAKGMKVSRPKTHFMDFTFEQN